MKILLPLFVLGSLTVSCTRLQYLTVNSSNPDIQKNAREQFVAENESVVVTYDFKGEGIPLGIKIINKQDKPLMVNWRKSSVVINDEAVPLSPDEAVTTGAARSGTLQLNRDMATTGTDFSAVTSLPAEKQQIPPRAFITRELMKVTGGWLGAEPMVMEHSFYIASITRTENYKVGGNRPYLVKATNFTKVMGGVIVGGALGVALAVAVNAADEKDKKD